ncbi:hypothetical protein QL285_088643 [Trifolium repens]|nr:hypothetical protein QL285_088643 [Trifolium repens]
MLGDHRTCVDAKNNETVHFNCAFIYVEKDVRSLKQGGKRLSSSAIRTQKIEIRNEREEMETREISEQTD